MRWNKQALKKWILWSNPKDSPEKIALKRTLKVHLLLLVLFSISSSPSFSKKPKQKMHVQTTYLQPKKPLAAKEKIALENTKKSSLAHVLENQKKAVKKQAPNLSKNPSKVTGKKEPSKNRLEQLEKNLKKIEDSFKESPKELFVAVEASVEVKESIPYETLVVHLLQKTLKLIDDESVDVHIHVQPNGIVDKIIEISSLSSLNARIVESALEKMVFPGFDGEEAIELNLHLCTGN